MSEDTLIVQIWKLTPIIKSSDISFWYTVSISAIPPWTYNNQQKREKNIVQGRQDT